MEKLVYTNKFGDKVTENVERFSIRGTIMSASISKVSDNAVVHRLVVEDGKGRYSVTIWNNAKGYDKDKLKAGLPLSAKGIVRRQVYPKSEGGFAEYVEYKALEIV